MTAKKIKVPPPATTLVLRVCNPDMTSSHGFTWPGVGQTATAADWENTKACGHGLHGWLHGQGDHTAAGGKIKYPCGIVRAVGDRKHATDYLLAKDPIARTVAVIGAQLQVGDKESVTVGALGQATAGHRGTATAGYRGTATAGDSGTATAGDSGTATAGHRGTATAGYRGTILIKWWESSKERYRVVTGYVGEDGIKANTPYKLDANHKLVEVKK